MGVSTTPKDRQRTSRAQRFVTELPVRYREVGTDAWHQGCTANISVSGVLFRAARMLQPKTEIEMTLTLPAVVRGEAAAELRCRGFVVRGLAGAGSDPSLGFDDLKQMLETTDGNLRVHARKLEEADYMACRKYAAMAASIAVYRFSRPRRGGAMGS